MSIVTPGKTSLRPVRERDRVEQLYRPRWRNALRVAVHGTALSLLLAAGTVWTLGQQHPAFTKPAELLRLPGAIINAPRSSEDAFRIGQVLRRYTRNGDVADRIAEAVVSEGLRRKIDPALLVGVMLVETDNLNPRARSFVGARGLMQVMPFHAGRWRCGSSDLYDIEANICHGVSVLADNIKRAPNLRTALQRYNGCVRGSNTPNCTAYSGKVMKATTKTSLQMMAIDMPPEG
ncbi:MAG: transglycosylase SLT domain-containing protein [Gemmatimonadaceae bacterium]